MLSYHSSETSSLLNVCSKMPVTVCLQCKFVTEMNNWVDLRLILKWTTAAAQPVVFPVDEPEPHT